MLAGSPEPLSPVEVGRILRLQRSSCSITSGQLWFSLVKSRASSCGGGVGGGVTEPWPGLEVGFGNGSAVARVSRAPGLLPGFLCRKDPGSVSPHNCAAPQSAGLQI